MRQLAKVRANAGGAGEALPTILQKFHQAGVRPQRGQVCMITAPPNAGKSFLSLYWTGRMAQRYGTRVLTFSADTDEHDTTIRAACMLTGQTSANVKNAFRSGEGWETYADELADLKSMRMDFETDPDFDYIGHNVLAFNETWGDYPEVIVIDNVMNVVTYEENEYSGMKSVTKFAKRLGRLTGAGIFLLHHMNEGGAKSDSDPRYPMGRDKITGKVSQLPELILSLGMDAELGIMRVACVKNRNGKANPNGGGWIEFYADVDRMAIYESQYDKVNGIPA